MADCRLPFMIYVSHFLSVLNIFLELATTYDVTLAICLYFKTSWHIRPSITSLDII